jgi:hypothetical protein
MNTERTKMFPLEGKTWKMNKVNALEGSNLLRMFTAAGNSNPQEFLANMPNDKFKPIQTILLSEVFLVKTINEQEISVPVILPSGQIEVEANDSGLLFMLTVISLMFNLSGFFEDNTLKEFQTVVASFNV